MFKHAIIDKSLEFGLNCFPFKKRKEKKEKVTLKVIKL